MILVAIGGLTFARPWLLWLLLAVPLVAALLLWLALWQRGVAKQLVGRGGPSRANGVARAVKAGMLVAGVALIAVAAARPQFGSRSVLLPREGTDVMIALDVSASMLATDVPPNRFQHAKELIGGLLDGLQGDRVGLTIFAGNAILRFPLTTDIDAARELVKSTSIREGNLKAGTGLGDAMRIAVSGFGDDAARSKLILLISDGEDLNGDALDAVRTPRDREIVVYTVALGTDTGSQLPVPDPRTGRVQPRVDPQTGQPAVSRANEALMRQIADAGRGKFFNGNADDAAAALAGEIGQLERTRFASQEGTVPVERYQWFLGAGIALIALQMLIPERKRTRRPARSEQRAGRRAA